MQRLLIALSAILLAALVAGIETSSAQATPAKSNAVACKVVSKKKTGKSIAFRTTLVVIRTKVSFCYNGRQVLRPSVVCEVIFHDTATVVDNGCDKQGGFFAWNGNPNGGYEALGTYKFSGCILKYGCWGSYTYNMHIWVYATGAWAHN